MKRVDEMKVLHFNNTTAYTVEFETLKYYHLFQVNLKESLNV